MKKILLLLFLLFFIYIVIINKEQVVNKTITNDNYSINYPYFSNSNINSYILSYLNKHINTKDYDKLIIDYDYDNKTKTLTIYKTTYKGNIINEKSKTFKISKNNIYEIEVTKNTTKEYNFNLNNNINSKYIALTFDDGPSINTSRVIDILNKYNARATFFITGKNIKGKEEVLRKMSSSNMEIANHTYNHLLLTKYSIEKIEEEIDKTSNQIFDVVGFYPSLLRPSYGAVNKKVKQASNMPIIIWDVDTLDWKYKNSKRIYNTVINKAKDGDIVLMHDIYKSTVNSLDLIIPELINNGYNLVTVSELFNYKNIKLEKGKVYGFAKN